MAKQVEKKIVNGKEILWLDDEAYHKAVGQLRMQIGAIMQPLTLYGQKIYVKQAVKELVKLSEDFGLRVRGIDKPISIEMIRRGKIDDTNGAED